MRCSGSHPNPVFFRIAAFLTENPYMHIFLDAGAGNILAFFEITGHKEMGRDLNTPTWVQHIAFQVKDEAVLLEAKAELMRSGLEVIGVTDHGIIKSIYFFDPNGHRIELTCVIGHPKDMEKLKEVAPQMLEEWARTKRPPRGSVWLHEKEFSRS